MNKKLQFPEISASPRRLLRLGGAPVSSALLVLFAAFSTNAQSTRPASALPDAPSSLLVFSQALQNSATISGTIKDVNGGVVPNARVSLSGQTQAPPIVVTSDTAGRFALPSLPPGRYALTVVAPGLEIFVVPEIVLAVGEQRELPPVTLPIAATNTSVDVTANAEQIAQAEVHAEEKQRVLGILPNFYTSYTWQAAPLNPRQKFQLASHSIFDPVALISDAGVAGAEQINNIYAGYGDDGPAFFKRYAAAIGDESIGRLFTSAVYPTLFHQDPRYFYRGTGSPASRAKYAILQVFVTRSDRTGKSEPNYSLFLGRFTAGAIANAYHPHADRGVALTVDNALLNIGGHAFDNLLREFLLRRLTPSVPAFANGKASPPKP